MQGDASDNLRSVRELFEEEARHRGLKGVLGVAAFEAIHASLMPVQKTRLRELSGEAYLPLLREGSVVSIAYAYPEEAIDSIANGSEGAWDKARWGAYAKAYKRLNAALNETSTRIAARVGGVAIPATTTGMTSTVSHVEEYYPTVVSHRVAAELSGVGWRGRNELIVNPAYSCAIRLASVLTTVPLERTPPSAEGCGDCRSCLDACSFLAHKDRLPNYREQCRRYMLHLGLEEDVCGKCVKACYRRSTRSAGFRL